MALFDITTLAPAPYRFLGTETTEDRKELNKAREIEGEVYTTNMCGGSCDLCGHAIWDVYKFRAADGRVIKLGCDCAEKALDPYNHHAARKALLSAKSKIASQKRKSAQKHRIAAGIELFEANRDRLMGLPHPNRYRAEQGDTMADYVDWMLANAGPSGKLKVLKLVQESLVCDTPPRI